MAGRSLPLALDEVELGDRASVRPEELLDDPAKVYRLPPEEQAAWALRYSRAGRTGSYDEIGFRFSAAVPVTAKGPVSLQTFYGVRLQRDREIRSRVSDPLTAILEEEEKLRHRAIDMPQDSGRFGYRVRGHLLELTIESDDGHSELWAYPLTAPLSILRHNAVAADAPLLLTQRYSVDIPGSFWLPAAALVRHGRFRRMQEWRGELAAATQPGQFFLFVSHRWLSPSEPDPEGVQAAFVAWQVFAHLCEALRVARHRGLREPRLRSPALGFTVGVAGSELAEALLVNVVRPALDDEGLSGAWDEARRLEALTEDYGAAAAADDPGLPRLRQVLADCPALAALLDRVHVWYDYACMPQPPRSASDEQLFRRGLENLVPIQLLGHTVVLLDDAEDYLGRGWCTLESLVADTAAVSMDVLIGSARPSARDGTAEHHYRMLLEDRPHITWRAMLDAEVFGVQTPLECLTRLGLAVTDPADLPFIYAGLQELPSPRKIHTDQSELVTGVYPVAVIDGTEIVVAEGQARPVGEPDPADRASIDWTGALRLSDGWRNAPGAAGAEPFYRVPDARTDRGTACHVAVVGGCEGEALLLSTWAVAHRADLESALGVRVVSVSWLAVDIAPVGVMPHATLQPVAVDAGTWVVVALDVRFAHCGVTGALAATVVSAGVRTMQLAVDSQSANLSQTTTASERTRRLPRPSDPPVHLGGLFRGSLDRLLEQPAGPSR